MTKRLLSHELTQLSQELGEWRAQRGPQRLPIPKKFMERAAALTATSGAAHVAYRLRLNKGRLNRFIAERQPQGGSATPKVDFVPITLTSTEASKSGEVTVDIQAADGDRMQLRLHASSGRDVSRLISAFLGVER